MSKKLKKELMKLREQYENQIEDLSTRATNTCSDAIYYDMKGQAAVLESVVADLTRLINAT
jgi:hypothetical protein